MLIEVDRNMCDFCPFYREIDDLYSCSSIKEMKPKHIDRFNHWVLDNCPLNNGKEVIVRKEI